MMHYESGLDYEDDFLFDDELDFEDIFGFSMYPALERYMDPRRFGMSRVLTRDHRVGPPSRLAIPTITGLLPSRLPIIPPSRVPSPDPRPFGHGHVPKLAEAHRRRIQSTEGFPQASDKNLLPKACLMGPPNWLKNLRQTEREQLPYKQFKVSSRSQEYITIADLMHPLPISSIHQIVNPALWRQFNAKRKEMIISKTDDVTLLKALKCTKEELDTCRRYTRNFDKRPEVEAVQYTDNMALLFHGTKNPQNINSILTTGLDERFGGGGLLGKGIYFADNPQKSMTYDKCGGVMFICAVLLGDCLSMDHKNDARLVVEPKKTEPQRRHPNDLVFDSIVGKPLRSDNEYVIYNRSQCVPLYMINYDVKVRPLSHLGLGGRNYLTARTDFPPFCWRSPSTGRTPMPDAARLLKNTWPYYANILFEKMGST